MKKASKIFTLGLVLMILCCSAAFADPVKSFSFIGLTKTEKVTITINDDEQTIEYATPSGTTLYNVLDYDISFAQDNGNQIFKAKVYNPIYNTGYDVLLYVSKSFADIRIGKKRLTFTTIRTNNVEPLE